MSQVLVWDRESVGMDAPCLALVQQFVAWGSDRGDTALDPFAGSATTAVAALGFGRRWVGWEIDPRFSRGGDRSHRP